MSSTSYGHVNPTTPPPLPVITFVLDQQLEFHHVVQKEHPVGVSW